jgi:hypothetical protein
MRRLFATAALIAALAPAAAFAQDGAPALTATGAVPVAVESTPAPAATPSMTHADVAGIQVRHDAADAHTVNTVAASGLHEGQGMALMVVGGAAMIGGLLIGGSGGDAVAIGGLAVGLIGLYQYVR